MRNESGSSTGVRPVGLIIRQKDPNNLEMPFDQLGEFITPTELFYIRSHFPTPEIDPAAYRLSIGGAVRRTLRLSYDDIRAIPSRTCVATLECAGNSRVFLVPPAPGAQWGLGAVGNAEWTGVSLSELLERAGLADDVCDIILEGADRGVPKEEPRPPGPISYARSIPKTRAMESDVLIAYQMNGQDLTPDHGYPLRAIVPGHYGMASVKWLTNIIATTQAFQGYWQTSDYAYNPFDLTEVWPHRDYPLIEVGVLELNRNPENYFAEVEQAALSPANIVPGISHSPDKMLQARIFSYADAHRYRIGINADQLPVNKPRCPVHTYNVDGAMRLAGNPNPDAYYEPNSFNGPQQDKRFSEPPLKLSGD